LYHTMHRVNIALVSASRQGRAAAVRLPLSSHVLPMQQTLAKSLSANIASFASVQSRNSRCSLRVFSTESAGAAAGAKPSDAGAKKQDAGAESAKAETEHPETEIPVEEEMPMSDEPFVARLSRCE
jgi:hypothetical protein